MKTKIIVLLLIFGTILLSGCMGNEQPSSKENATPAENVTTVDNTTVVGTPEENVTTVDNKTEKNVTTVDNNTEENTTTADNNMTTGRLAISSPKIQDTSYLVRLQNYKSSSSSLTIKKGEKVSWLNLHDSPKRVFTLVSQENLFNNTSLVYKRSFTYTFNETGDYHFSVIGQPRMNVNVSVTEP
jgi:plastocyanin